MPTICNDTLECYIIELSDRRRRRREHQPRVNTKIIISLLTNMEEALGEVNTVDIFNFLTPPTL